MSATFSTPGTLRRRGEPPTPDPTGPRTPRGLRWRLRYVLARAALVVAGLVSGALAGEAVVRGLGWEFRPHLRNRVYFAEPDRLLGWRNRANLSGPYGGDEFLTRVTQNAAGQRGTLHSPERAPGKRRIVLLGDSQAWGDGVGDDETFAARLEQGGIEVVNLAVPGYGTDQELLAFDHVGVHYAPDVVLIATYLGNDLRDNVSQGTWQYPKPHFGETPTGELDLRGVPVPYSPTFHLFNEIYRALMRHSVLLNAIGTATEATPPGPLGPDDGGEVPVYSTAYAATPRESDRRGIAMTVRLLLEIARRARAAGARPVVLLIPDPWQVEVANRPRWRAELRRKGIDWRRPQREIGRALAADGVEVVDVLPALARASRPLDSAPRQAFYPGWRHLTERGHRVVARHLAARLRLEPPPA